MGDAFVQHPRRVPGGDRAGEPIGPPHRRRLQQPLPVRDPRRHQDAPLRHRVRAIPPERYELLPSADPLAAASSSFGLDWVGAALPCCSICVDIDWRFPIRSPRIAISIRQFEDLGTIRLIRARSPVRMPCKALFLFIFALSGNSGGKLVSWT